MLLEVLLMGRDGGEMKGNNLEPHGAILNSLILPNESAKRLLLANIHLQELSYIRQHWGGGGHRNLEDTEGTSLMCPCSSW